MDKLEIFATLTRDAAKGELAFPTSARVAMKVQQAVSDPDCHVDAASRLIQAEPLLAARVVATANSVAYNRSGREITDVKASVARLGFRTVRSLATALVTRQLASKSLTPEHERLAAQLWEHTAHVAALAQVIARRVTHIDPEAAMFAGIVHEVGGFFLISRASEFPGLLDGGFDDWQGSGEAQVGAALLKVLAVPDTVASAMQAFWDGYMALPPVTLGDTLLLAEQLAPIASPLHASSEPASLNDTASIEVALGEETLTGILRESQEEVSSLTAALRF